MKTTIARAIALCQILCLSASVFAQADPSQTSKKPEKKPLPLETTRKIEFTTDEGTWMSVDISPDGRTVIFDLLGDIYTLPIGGGKATSLLAGLPFESQPKFSPDGKMIAFVSDRSGSNNLWIANADGSEPKQLSKEMQAEISSPSWLPDGSGVLVSKLSGTAPGGYESWLYLVDGGSGLKVTKSPERPAGGGGQAATAQEFGPITNGRKLWFARMASRPGPRLELPEVQVYERDLETNEEDPITFLNGKAFAPVVSGDGKYLVFASRYEAKTGFRIRDLRTGDERWLKYPVQRDEVESRPTRGLMPAYTFSPDGSFLLAAYGGKIHRIAVSDGSESVIPFSADVSMDLGPSLYVENKLDQGPVRARLIQEPDFDGNSNVVFSAMGAVYLKRGESGPVRLTGSERAREFQPAFSPDGKSVAFVSWTTAGGSIETIPVSGGQPRTVTRSKAFFKEPAFTPDGRSIIALSTSRQTRVNHPSDFLGPQPGLDIVSVPANGGEARVLVDARGLGKPHFGPETDRFYVYGNRGLVSYRLDGSDERVKLQVVGKSRGPIPNPAIDVRLSPDGRHALARFRNGQLYIVKVPSVSGGAPTINISAPAVPVKRLSTIGADSFRWTDGGEGVAWTVGSTIFRKKVSELEFAEPKKDAKKPGESPVAEEDRTGKPVEDDIKASSEEIVITRPRHVPTGTALLRGARIITMRGEEILDPGDVLVRDNRIEKIGKSGSIPVPAGTKVFDLKGKVIMPGIVDVHAHWEVRHSVLDTEDYTFLANLAYGVTTGRDPQTNTNDTFAYQDLVDTGDMIGPRIFTTGPGVFSDTDFKSYEEAYNTIARYKKHYRAETLKSYLVGNRQQRQFVVQASKALGIIPTTEGGSNFAMNLTHAIDGFAGNEHSLPIVPLYDDVAQLFARSGITYTPTLVVAYGGPQGKYYFFEKSDVYADKKLKRFNPQAVLDEKTARLPFFRDEEYIFPQIAAGASKIVAAGGRVAVGGHGELQGLQCHWEMWGYAMGGMPNHDILKTATILGAEAIGHGTELGSLEPGKMADLLVLDADPLKDIRNSSKIRYVMKNGEMYDGETMDTVYPEAKSLPQMWWWKDKP